MLPPQFTMWAASIETQTMLALINAMVCAPIFFIVLCRTLKMHPKETRMMVKLLYVVVGVAAVSSGLSKWMWGETPGPGQIGMGVVVLMNMLVWRRNWANGQPPDAIKEGSKNV